MMDLRSHAHTSLHMLLHIRYAWTVNFEKGKRLSSERTVASCYKYIVCWIGKTEGSPTGLGKRISDG